MLNWDQVSPQKRSRVWVPDTCISEIPVNEYYEYFGPDYELDVKSSNTDDMNTPAYLDRVKRIVMDNLRHTGGPPSVQMSGPYLARSPGRMNLNSVT